MSLRVCQCGKLTGYRRCPWCGRGAGLAPRVADPASLRAFDGQAGASRAVLVEGHSIAAHAPESGAGAAELPAPISARGRGVPRWLAALVALGWPGRR
jgi:hypothetical protein